LQRGTYQISQRIQLLAHEAALLPPARDLTVHEIEEEAKGHERQRRPEVAQRGWRAQAVPHGREDRHDPTESYRLQSRIISICALFKVEVLDKGKGIEGLFPRTVELSYEVCQVQHADQGEMACCLV
jgi:hypothetical protein